MFYIGPISDGKILSVPQSLVMVIMKIWTMKLSRPTRIIASNVIFVLVQSSVLDGLVASLRMRLLS